MSDRRRKRPRAPAGCYWKGNKLYGRIQVDGKTIARSLATDDAKIAAKRQEKLKQEEIGRKYGDARLTFLQVSEEWTKWLPGRVAGDDTPDTYINALAQMDRWLVGKHMDEITPRLIGAIVSARQEAVTIATVRRGLTALSSLFTYAVKRQYVQTNPVTPFFDELVERRLPIVLPRSQDVAKVVKRAPGLMSALVLAARATGCRQSELVEATHSQLDLPARRLLVIGKRRKLRVIDLEPFGGVDVFSDLPPGIGRGPLFWHGQSEPYRQLATRFACLTREIAKSDPDFCRFAFHHLRHLHAVEWLRSGRSIYTLQKRLGHASIKQTEWYCTYLTTEEELVCRELVSATKTATDVQRKGEEAGCHHLPPQVQVPDR